MKTIFKGMVLLLAGASFVACSKDVSFDENAQKQAEEDRERRENSWWNKLKKNVTKFGTTIFSDED